MIYSQKKIIIIGSIVKTHGVHGALMVRLIAGFNTSILNKASSCFLMIRNKPVPFKVLEAIESSNCEVILLFADIQSKPHAEEFLNLEIAVERNSPIRKKKTDNILLLVGYKIYNDGVLVGTVQNIENPGKQFLFVLENDLLLPAHDDLIEFIDDKKKSIFMKLPEGLI